MWKPHKCKNCCSAYLYEGSEKAKAMQHELYSLSCTYTRLMLFFSTSQSLSVYLAFLCSSVGLPGLGQKLGGKQHCLVQSFQEYYFADCVHTESWCTICSVRLKHSTWIRWRQCCRSCFCICISQWTDTILRLHIYSFNFVALTA